MKALITGIGGFVGTHLTQELNNHGYEVCGMDIAGNAPNTHIVNLLDKAAVIGMISETRADCIFHLAAQASVRLSWENPQLTFDVNVKGTLNLLEAVRSLDHPTRIIIIGSSDQYGHIQPEDCPIKESLRIDPVSPYSISKQTQENLVKSYIHAYNMNIVMTRSFNHCGPGQRTGFVVSDFASRIAAIERGESPLITVGNLEAKRDFTDVRDIVRAYRLLNEAGMTGEIYNVGSGQAHSVREILEMLIDLSQCQIEICVDPDRMRPSDLPLIQCDNTKIRQQTGWSATIPLRQTLLDTLQYWRNLNGR